MKVFFCCKIDVNAEEYGMSAVELIKELEGQDPGIYTRNHQVNMGSFAVDPRPLTSNNDLEIIYEALDKFAK